jgi:hypothetical protein
MAPRRKTLDELVRERTFLSRRHADRLLEAPLPRADLSALQESFAAARRDEAKEGIALAFERAVRGLGDVDPDADPWVTHVLSNVELAPGAFDRIEAVNARARTPQGRAFA